MVATTPLFPALVEAKRERTSPPARSPPARRPAPTRGAIVRAALSAGNAPLVLRALETTGWTADDALDPVDEACLAALDAPVMLEALEADARGLLLVLALWTDLRGQPERQERLLRALVRHAHEPALAGARLPARIADWLTDALIDGWRRTPGASQALLDAARIVQAGVPRDWHAPLLDYVARFYAGSPDCQAALTDVRALLSLPLPTLAASLGCASA